MVWIKKTFEAIGDQFGGLEDITLETLNGINCSETRIKSKRIFVDLCLPR